MAKKVNEAPKINTNIFSSVTKLKKENTAPEVKPETKKKEVAVKEVVAEKEEAAELTAVNIYLTKEDRRQLKILLADKDLKQKEYLSGVVSAALRKAGY